MSASHPHAHDLPRGDSLLPAWVKDAVRSILDPIVNIALAMHVTANMVTVLGLVIVVVAALLIGSGSLVAGALILMGGSLLDAVDGALARATGGGTPFGGFLDSTLDRAGEAIVYLAVAAYYLQGSAPTWPVLAAFVALAGSFMVSYSRARAEGIGSTLTGVMGTFVADEVMEILGVPKDEGWHMHGVVPMGYPTGQWGVAPRTPAVRRT